MKQAFIKSTPLAECRLIPFIYRLVMLPASFPSLSHPTALAPASDSWPEPKPPTDQDSRRNNASQVTRRRLHVAELAERLGV